jgi:CPA1 family monovalent cation:H+ antiporter
VPPTFRGGLVVSWAGMRGIVTLAAAFALPETLPDGSPFPYRDLVVLSAFAVVLGTLVLQGLTLRPLILALRLEDGDPVGAEVRLARGEAYRAALAAIDGDETLAAKILRKEYALFTDEAEDAEGPHANRLRIRAIAAARGRTQQLLSDGTIGDDAYHRLEEELDWAELRASNPSAL